MDDARRDFFLMNAANIVPVRLVGGFGVGFYLINVLIKVGTNNSTERRVRIRRSLKMRFCLVKLSSKDQLPAFSRPRFDNRHRCESINAHNQTGLAATLNLIEA